MLPMLLNCTWYTVLVNVSYIYIYINWSQQYDNHLIPDCTGDVIYTKHEDNVAIYPYNISNNIAECECQHRCDRDPRCNGYAFDDDMGTCSLSRCNTINQSITDSMSIGSDFYGKEIPTIHLSCAPVTTDDTTLKFTTPTSLNSVSINDATQNKVNIALCVCVCKYVNQTMETSIRERRRELTLDKTKLSSYMRKHTSARDSRTTSRVFGFMAVIILVMYGVLFFCNDIWTLFAMCHSKMMYKTNPIQPGI